MLIITVIFVTSIIKLHQTYPADFSGSGCIITLGGMAGTAAFADRMVIGLPLDMTYTAQYSGTDLIKQDWTSGFLNFLQDGKHMFSVHKDHKAWKI